MGEKSRISIFLSGTFAKVVKFGKGNWAAKAFPSVKIAFAAAAARLQNGFAYLAYLAQFA